MALENTSERYNYIFGSTVRKVDESDLSYKPRGYAGRAPAVPGYRQPRERIYVAPAPEKKARRRKKTSHALDFDWKFTVIATLAASMILACSIFYVRGTVTLHNLYGQVTDLKAEKTRLLGKQTALEAEIDKAMNLNEIRTYARNNLGMVYPGKDQVIYYTDSNNDYIRQYESVDTGR